MDIKKNVKLSDHTTIALGGTASYFISCKSPDEIIEALKLSAEKNLQVQVMSGGSNIVFPDSGFQGVVISVDIKGITFNKNGDDIFVIAGAGENLDGLISECIKHGYAGIECLSGIPGSAGAAPIQNAGAYGQEIADVLEYVSVIDRSDLSFKKFTNPECGFSYRQSRFKKEDADKFIITEICIRLSEVNLQEIKYRALNERLSGIQDFEKTKDIKEKLNTIRNTVIEIRKEKSMVLDKSDINSRSCGSFFMNPVLNENEFNEFRNNISKQHSEFPFYKSGNEFKIPAAWLVENSGFEKGYVKKGVGISSNHSLALINISGTSAGLIQLSEEIQNAVKIKFGISLIPEPVIILSH
ncbi:MAG: UDP-N-acetylmuramate dehydrogenase [Ignavibacteria bacterium]|nr:UDP-N-acetylmuramate dehydrogenase [Ignavibacteria bacterium]